MSRKERKEGKYMIVTKSSYGKYSLEETAIGTWVDGRTIYRKVFISDEGVTLGYNNPFTFTHGLNVLTPIHASIVPIQITDDGVVITDYEVPSGSTPTLLKFNQKTVIISKSSSGNYWDWRYLVILEYTKSD